MMRYAITTVALPHLSLDETVRFAADLGYDGIELRVRHIPPGARNAPTYSFWGNHKNDLNPDNFVEQAPRIKELCDAYGLRIPALAANATATDLDDLRRLAEGAALCGCPLVRIGFPRRYDGNVPYRELYREAVSTFSRALETIRPFGVRGLVEIHGGTIAVSTGLALRLVEHFTPEEIGAIYDLNNMVREGYEGIALGLDVLGPYLAHVHIGGHEPRPDARQADGTLPWSWQGTELADGLLSMPVLLKELRRSGYDGFITVEDFRADVETRDKFSTAMTYLRGLEG